MVLDQPCRTERFLSKSFLAACIDKSPMGGPQAHNDAHRCATGRTAGRERLRGRALWRLAIDGMCRHDHQADGVGRDGTAGMEKATMTDFPQAIGQDVREDPAEKLDGVEVGGAWACTAHCTRGKSDRAVLERDDAAVGNRDPEAIRGARGEGRGSMVMGLTVDVPGDAPALGGDVLQQSGLAHVFFEKSAGDGGEGFDRDKEVGSGGQPR